MNFVLPADLALYYSHSGGSPPPSLDLLTLTLDGTGTYLAGNPWPRQPPFDQIGWYRAGLPADLRAAVTEALRTAVPGSAPSFPDAGQELFAVRSGDRTILARCSPGEAPPALAPLRSAAHQIIRWLRSHPLAGVRGTCRIEEAGSPRVDLQLQHLGLKPFSFHGPASPGAELEVRAGLRFGDGDPNAHTRMAERLAGTDPLPLISVDGAQADNAEWRLEPGSTIDVRLDGSRLGTEADGRTGGTLECLTRLCFPRSDAGGTPFVQEGWLLTSADLGQRDRVT